MFGTGQIVYAQAGYLCLAHTGFYVSASYASYDRLNGLKTFVMDAGINYLIQGHQSKLSLNFQNRPTYGIENGVVTAGNGKIV